MKLQYLLPPVYQKLISQDILGMEINELKATCDACAMTPERNPGGLNYQENLKCCTFYPFMPNYLVGAILSENSEGSKIVRQMIADKSYVLPIGMVAPPAYQYKFKSRRPLDFGNREDLLCPYYDLEKNNCHIWRHRGAVCSSFYCQSSAGKKGKDFWSELSDYLSYVEMALMEEALVMLDFSPRQIIDLIEFTNPQDLSLSQSQLWTLPEKKSRELWNGYFDDQEAFFKKSLAVIQNLSQETWLEALGEMGESRLLNLKNKAAQVQFKRGPNVSS